jgi:hypothetical protein
MKITESKLRQIIREELKETADVVPAAGAVEDSEPSIKPGQLRKWKPGGGEYQQGFFRIEGSGVNLDWSIGKLDMSGHTTPATASAERSSWGYTLLDQNLQPRKNPRTGKPYPPMTATSIALMRNSTPA